MPIPGTRSISIPMSPSIQNTKAAASNRVNSDGVLKIMTKITAIIAGRNLRNVVALATFVSPDSAFLSWRKIEIIATIQKAAL